MTWQNAKNSWYFFAFLPFFLLFSLVPSHTLYWDKQKRTWFWKIMKKFCSSTYKAFESIFTNPLLQVFFAKMKYSLTNSKFQEAFGRYFRRKIIFLLITCGNEDYVSCFWKKVKKEAPTFIVNACHMSLLILKNSCGKSTGVLVIFFIPFSSFLRLTIRWLLLLKRLA